MRAISTLLAGALLFPVMASIPALAVQQVEMIAYFPNSDIGMDRYPRLSIDDDNNIRIALSREKISLSTQSLLAVKFCLDDFRTVDSPVEILASMEIAAKTAGARAGAERGRDSKASGAYAGAQNWDPLNPLRLFYINGGTLFMMNGVDPGGPPPPKPAKVFPPSKLRAAAGETMRPVISSNGRLAFVSSFNLGDLYLIEPSTIATGVGEIEMIEDEKDLSPLVKRLTKSPGFETQLDWSPDGNRIAYINSEESKTSLHILNVGTMNDLTLVKGEPVCANPVWSPDGSMIAYYTIRSQTSATGQAEKLYDLNVIPVDGGAARPIAQDVSRNEMYGPAFVSPGQKLVYVSNADKGVAIYDLTKKEKSALSLLNEQKQPIRLPTDISTLPGRPIFALSGYNTEGVYRVYVFRIREG